MRALTAATAVLYRGAEDADLSFETLLEEGISRAEADRDRAATVAFDVEYQPLDANRLARKLRQTGSLTLSELAYLRESDDASLDRLLDEYATAVDAEADTDGWEQATMNRF